MTGRKPDILLITTDQQRYDASGGAGPDFLRTPHFDHLRRGGVTFARAYSDCPLCVPARVSIMTGRYATSHGQTGNGPTEGFIPRDRSLPSVLRSLGYATAAIGKMHFGPERARHGFDEMILPADYYRWMDRAPHPWRPMRHGMGQNELYPAMATVPECLTLTSWTAEQCVEYIRERRDPTVPFFLWCSFSKPHPPLDPPEPYYSMYRASPIPAPAIGTWVDSPRCPAAIRRAIGEWSSDLLTPDLLREARAAYYGLITQIDYNMGRVFAALQDRGLFDETLIIYTSDHGEFLGDHRLAAKTFMLEGSAHIPFVIRPPKSWGIPPGTVSDALVTHADILPTLAAAAGVSPPPECDGMDLLALLRGSTAPRRYLHAVGGRAGSPAYMGVTDGRWKYIYYPEGPAEQLFDLASDPMELSDLAGAAGYERIAEELREEVRRRHADGRTGFAPDGRLPVRPAAADSTSERRARIWPGYHTEHYDKDVRH
ncbi:MAG: sulfatase-like hydrolase/transferase [Planctomycetota bacterium]|nr:sulfatase-like hydrolase/transferase [Planctomycetota bacterium]